MGGVEGVKMKLYGGIGTETTPLVPRKKIIRIYVKKESRGKLQSILGFIMSSSLF